MRIQFRKKSRRRLGFTLIEVLVVIGIVVLLIGLLLPAVNSARNSGYKAVDASNLRQLALGIIQYHDANGYLPHSIRDPNQPNLPRQNWVSQILPFIERNDIAGRYNYNVNWNDPANALAILTPINTLVNPASPNPSRLDEAPENWGTGSGINAISDYAAITSVGPGLLAAGYVDSAGPGILAKNVKSRFSDVTDGLSNTILLADSAGRPNLWIRGKRLGDPQTGKFNPSGATPASGFVNGGGWARNASDISLEGLLLNQTFGTTGSSSSKLGGSTTYVTLVQGSSQVPTAVSGSGGTVNTNFDGSLWVINVSNGVDLSAYNKGNGGTDLGTYTGTGNTATGVTYFKTSGTGAIYSFLPAGANVAFGDGAVKFINEKIDVRVLGRLVTRDQNEVTDLSAL